MSRSIKLLVATSMAVLVLIPAVAVASHQFSDVPTTKLIWGESR